MEEQYSRIFLSKLRFDLLAIHQTRKQLADFIRGHGDATTDRLQRDRIPAKFDDCGR